jgi:hypothetical protein
MMRFMSTASLSKARPRTPLSRPIRPESLSSFKHYVAGLSPIPFNKWLHFVIFLIHHYFCMRSSPYFPNPHGAVAHRRHWQSTSLAQRLYRHAVHQTLPFPLHFFILSARVPVDEIFFSFHLARRGFFILGSVLSQSKVRIPCSYLLDWS